MKGQKVGCICLTYNNIAHFEQCVKNFVLQTYKDKVLIIVDNSKAFSGYTNKINEIIARYGIEKESILITEYRRFHLGHYRNMALNKAYEIGCRYIATFDDDDIFTKKRLEMQIKSLKKTKKMISLLQRFTIVYMPKANVRYDFKCSLHNDFMGLETTLVMDLEKERELNPVERVKYRMMSFAEDSLFVKDLTERYGDDCIDILENDYKDYEYIFHGGNISGDKHFRQMIDMYQDKGKDGKQGN